MRRQTLVLGALAHLLIQIVRSGSAHALVPAVRAEEHDLGPAARIPAISASLLDRPFRDNALGEGRGHYDADPLFRMDAFDCTTYVETVWALSATPEGGDPSATLQSLRYREGQVDFIKRLHFTALDWVPYHQQRGVLRPIDLAPGLPALESRTLIDEQAWYQRMHPSQLARFQQSVPDARPQLSQLSYFGFRDFIQSPASQDVLRDKLKKEALLINFVRPDWDTVRYIGTRIDISHQGFLVLKGDQIFLRHASAAKGKVVEEDFISYAKAYQSHATLRGFQVFQILGV